jgi:hypothetical protein
MTEQLPDYPQTPNTTMVAQGMLVGALSQAPPDLVVLHSTLARGEKGYPHLYVRFPGRLRSTYEVTVQLVPGTATTDGE